MALDRHAIEKKDFPIGRRGYEPEAVDAHLAQLADEVDALRSAADRRSGASLASAAAEQVRTIVEAAEQSAQDIERDARDEATQIRAEAQEDARRIDAEAVERSREQVGRVTDAAGVLLQRVDAMEAEFASLAETLRTGVNRMNADLAQLYTNMGELYASAGAELGGTPPAAPATAPAPAPAAVAAPAPAAAVEPAPAPAPAAAPAPAGDGDGDVEGARLIALNMALNGQSREQTDRYLAENFDLVDRDALLDEVYSSIGGSG
jgi:DivIVA domain-containing protein